MQEAEELAALVEEEVEEVAEANVFGVQAGVGLQTPLEIVAAPWAEVVSASRGPEKSEGFEHGAGVDYTRRAKVSERWRMRAEG